MAYLILSLVWNDSWKSRGKFFCSRVKEGVHMSNRCLHSEHHVHQANITISNKKQFTQMTHHVFTIFLQISGIYFNTGAF